MRPPVGSSQPWGETDNHTDESLMRSVEKQESQAPRGTRRGRKQEHLTQESFLEQATLRPRGRVRGAGRVFHSTCVSLDV